MSYRYLDMNIRVANFHLLPEHCIPEKFNKIDFLNKSQMCEIKKFLKIFFVYKCSGKLTTLESAGDCLA